MLLYALRLFSRELQALDSRITGRRQT
jgi:hypothetical protein